jgi:hypothetical protein
MPEKGLILLIFSKRVVSVCGLMIIASFIYFGLAPFNFSPVNRVSWDRGKEGLYFAGKEGPWPHSVGGMAFSAVLKALDAGRPVREGAITISIRLKPAEEPSAGVPHFFALADAKDREILYLGQWKRTLIIGRYAVGPHGRRVRNELGLSGALASETVRQLAVVSDQAGTTVYLDGREAKRFPGKSLLAPRDSVRNCHIVLGNSPYAANAWTGSIFEVSVFEEALLPENASRAERLMGDSPPDPVFVEGGLVAWFDLREGPAPVVLDRSGNGNTLLIPKEVHAKSRYLEWTAPSGGLTWSLVKDVSQNILGFVIFGFVFALWTSAGKRSAVQSYLFVFLLGSSISLSIETIQALIPSRSSDLRDLISNILGALLGILVFHLCRRQIGIKPGLKNAAAELGNGQT